MRQLIARVHLPRTADTCIVKEVKLAHTRLPSVGFRSWSRFLAVSLQVTWVINSALGCHYFPQGLQLPPQPLRGQLPILFLVNRGTMGVNSLPKTRQRHDCDLNPAPSGPESSTLTTRLPNHTRAGNHVLHGVHIGATWWLQLIDPCATAMRPSDKLLCLFGWFYTFFLSLLALTWFYYFQLYSTE